MGGVNKNCVKSLSSLSVFTSVIVISYVTWNQFGISELVVYIDCKDVFVHQANGTDIVYRGTY